MLYNIKDHGFEFIEGVLTQEELEAYRDLTDRIVQYAEKGLEDPFSPYYMRHRSDQGVLYDLFQRHPEFQSLARHPKILAKLSEVMGDDIFLYENSLVYKPKGKANEVPWHQDFINRPEEPIKFIVWIALDDVKISNGAMKVIPGSHKLGFLPYFQIPGETHHTRLVLDGVDTDNYVYAEMKAGDVLIFNQLLIHSSDRIDVTEPRRAYRYSTQSFDQVFTPRGTPIVLKGGLPESVAKRYNARYSPPAPQPSAPVPQKGIVKRAINFVGRKLASF